MSRSWTSGVTGAFLVALMVLAGCGDSDSDDEGPSGWDLTQVTGEDSADMLGEGELPQDDSAALSSFGGLPEDEWPLDDAMAVAEETARAIAAGDCARAAVVVSNDSNPKEYGLDCTDSDDYNEWVDFGALGLQFQSVKKSENTPRDLPYAEDFTDFGLVVAVWTNPAGYRLEGEFEVVEVDGRWYSYRLPDPEDLMR